MAYVRLVVLNKDEYPARRQGLFQPIADSEYSGVLQQYEQSIHDEIETWFDRNLEKPSSLSRSSRRHAKGMALSWFKDSAIKHIQNMHSLAQLLRAHDVHVEVIKIERPGYVVY